MGNTYSQIYIHIVFTVKYRQRLILDEFREELHKYIAGIVTKRGQKMLAIYAMPDHVHILLGMTPEKSISDIVRDIKSASSKFITENNFVKGKFSWQEGYGAFSYSKSQIDNVINYIQTQEEHHKTKTFKEEYIKILEKFGVEYDEKYLFDWII